MSFFCLKWCRAGIDLLARLFGVRLSFYHHWKGLLNLHGKSWSNFLLSTYLLLLEGRRDQHYNNGIRTGMALFTRQSGNWHWLSTNTKIRATFMRNTLWFTHFLRISFRLRRDTIDASKYTGFEIGNIAWKLSTTTAKCNKMIGLSIFDRPMSVAWWNSTLVVITSALWSWSNQTLLFILAMGERRLKQKEDSIELFPWRFIWTFLWCQNFPHPIISVGRRCIPAFYTKNTLT